MWYCRLPRGFGFLFGGNCILTWIELLNSPLTVLSHPFLLHLNQCQKKSHCIDISHISLKHTGTTKTPLYWLLVQMNKTVPYKFTSLNGTKVNMKSKLIVFTLIIHILGLIVNSFCFWGTTTALIFSIITKT